MVIIKKYNSKKTRIKKEMFESLCKLQCTETEIASVFDVCEDTLNTWCKETYGETFSDTFKKKSAGGRVALRRTQFRIADSNPTMAIWLGKQYLGQRDNFEEVNNEEIDKAKEIIVSIRKSVDDK